jgi:hypothetical protein
VTTDVRDRDVERILRDVLAAHDVHVLAVGAHAHLMAGESQ